MKQTAYLQNKGFPYLVILVTFGLYVANFALYHDRAGIGAAALAIIPVVGASWYLGVAGATLTAVLSILATTAILLSEGHSHETLFSSPGNLIGTLSLIFTGIVVGMFGSTIRARRDAIQRLEKYERDRQVHTEFLELLNEITGMALEAHSLDATLKILVERIGKLFEAKDCFFSLWDETKNVPVPTVAYSSISDVYPYIQFEVGERTPTVSVIEAGYPIAIPDLENSPHVSPKVAAIYPSRSMLALPLIVQGRRLGAILLGYKRRRSFNENELTRVRIAAEQIASVVSKSLLLEEEHKQVKQLTALHDIALISIDSRS